MRKKLEEIIPLEITSDNMHEFVLTLKDKERFGDLTAMVLAKKPDRPGLLCADGLFPADCKRSGDDRAYRNRISAHDG